ncbi:hypothetical protein H9P43_007692 [Blastocladiella emersonii ATCC 22665]|nr:hypothetical protein H9P43_007692 [Blastocladiella emersonii ATCC 22665]
MHRLMYPHALSRPRLAATAARAPTIRGYATAAVTATGSLYDVLELTPAADKRKIKASYYRLSKQYHPDVNASAEAKDRFLAISDAYAVLGNETKRREYDRSRISKSSRHLSSAPRGSGSMRNAPRQRTYGAYDPSTSKPRTGARNASQFNYDAHEWEHYGREEAARSAANMNNARHREREQKRREDEWKEWQAELSRGKAEINRSWILGLGFSAIAISAVFWGHA